MDLAQLGPELWKNFVVSIMLERSNYYRILADVASPAYNDILSHLVYAGAKISELVKEGQLQGRPYELPSVTKEPCTYEPFCPLVSNDIAIRSLFPFKVQVHADKGNELFGLCGSGRTLACSVNFASVPCTI